MARVNRRCDKDIGQIHAIGATVGRQPGNDGDVFVERLRRMHHEINLSAPGCGLADFEPSIQRILDALGGNGQQRRFEPDQVGVGGDARLAGQT